MPPEGDHVDQTSEDVVTGVEVIDGVLVFRRASGSTQNVVLGDLLEEPIAGAAQAAVVATPAAVDSYGFTEAQANAIVTLVNALRAALIEANIIKGSA